MLAFESQFVNELGNPIRARVDDSGENGVLVTLEGPDSISENDITRLEAEHLFLRLGQFLGKL
jgi:hypothetical protein